MGDAATWTEAYEVRSYEVDTGGRVSVPTLCNWLQETAGVHADRLGWSVHRLGERGLTWVLQRLRLRLHAAARWGERVTVETWPVGTQRLFALRDFRLAAADGTPVGVATSCWILLDLGTRRPVRPPHELEEMAVHGAGRALVDGLERAPEPAPPLRERALEVRHADLDVNRHANNVSVISWLLEALGDEELAASLAELDVEFRAEALRGDRVLSQVGTIAAAPHAFAHRLLRAADGRELARARTAWRP